jgi:hypothetical protein
LPVRAALRAFFHPFTTKAERSPATLVKNVGAPTFKVVSEGYLTNLQKAH